MDDNLAQPSSAPAVHNTQGNGPEISEEEEDIPDWTKLKIFASSLSKPSLPKRGDKEFEPAQGGQSSFQQHSLNRSRDAMFNALQAGRGTSNKSISYAIWYPDISRAAMIQIRGVLFNGIGHSVPRPVSLGALKLRKRTELLPEEALYLIERGSLFCWKHHPEVDEAVIDEQDGHEIHGIPMTVQQAYAEMIGKEDLTLEKYQVYAYLKRLGFNVLRSHPPSEYYPIPPLIHQPNSSVSHQICFAFKSFFVSLWRQLFRRIDWWKPFKTNWLFGCARNYASLYNALRIIPSGHRVALHPVSYYPPTSSYKLFYNVYKPITPFRKTMPPAPDFSLVVVDARTTPLPTLHELTDLWSQLPETPVPPPRKKNQGKPTNPNSQIKIAPETTVPTSSSPLSFSRLFSWLAPRTHLLQDSPVNVTPRPPHPFAVLKNGKKTVVIGVVDCGTVSFYRFSSGAFEEMPLF